MPRLPRIVAGNNVYHIVNRAIGKLSIFNSFDDFNLFISCVKEAQLKLDMRILAYCIMPNHWHLLLYPKNDSDISLFMHQLTNAHTRKFHLKTQTVGTGPLYQGRYFSSLVNTDNYVLAVIKYIEQNPLRARLVLRVEDWQWSSARLRLTNINPHAPIITDAPISLPSNYHEWVNILENDVNENVRKSIQKGIPFGSDVWVENMRFMQKRTVEERRKVKVIHSLVPDPN